jgi:hypothetical protein
MQSSQEGLFPTLSANGLECKISKKEPEANTSLEPTLLHLLESNEKPAHKNDQGDIQL